MEKPNRHSVMHIQSDDYGSFASPAKAQAEPESQLEPAEPERGHWTGKLDFVLSALGYAVGLGNVWRFPYLCFKNGGGAFLIPYTLMLFIIGLPCFLLDLTLGQYSALAPLVMFRNLCPAFKGLGLAMLLGACMSAISYNTVIAWSIYYMFASFTSDLPWQYCTNDYNSDNCFNDLDYKKCKAGNESNIYNHGRCFTNLTEASLLNITEDVHIDDRISSSEEYLNRQVLKMSSGIGTLGSVNWGMALSLLLAWVCVCLSLIKGIKSSGKVVYFTATFPYVIMVVLVIRGTTLPGAIEGIKFYIIPEWERLTDIVVWEKAAAQIFYSLSIGGGGLIVLASYNKFHNNIIRDTLIVSFANCLTSIFAGFAIFSILGFMATELGVKVKDVARGGAGLAFVAYPDAVTRLPLSPLWAILFFFMLFLLGLDSQFVIVEKVNSSLMDEFPFLRPKKSWMILLLCSTLYLIGIPLTTQGGIYVLELMDNYLAGWVILLYGLIELFIVGYIYGFQNFLDNLHQMVAAFKPGLWLKSHMLVLYCTLAPAAISAILLLSWIEYKPFATGTYVFPDWANGIGWLMALVPLSFIPFLFCKQLFYDHRHLPLRKRLRLMITPQEKWWENSKRAAEEDKAVLMSHNDISLSSTTKGDVVRYYQREDAAYDNPGLKDEESSNL